MLSADILETIPTCGAGRDLSGVPTDSDGVFTLSTSLRTISLSHSLRTKAEQRQYIADRQAEQRQSLLDLGATASFLDRDRRQSKAISKAFTKGLQSLRFDDAMFFDGGYGPPVRTALQQIRLHDRSWPQLVASMRDWSDEEVSIAVEKHRTHRVALLGQFHTALKRDPWTNQQREVTPLRGDIKEFSSKSKSNMFKTVAAIDFSSWDPSRVGMVTITLAEDFLSVAPSGEVYKGLVRTFWKRVDRFWGSGTSERLWKQEYQGRGAPHQHACMQIPDPVRRVQPDSKCLRHTKHQHFSPEPVLPPVPVAYAPMASYPDDLERVRRYTKTPLTYSVKLNVGSWRYAAPLKARQAFTRAQVEQMAQCDCVCTCKHKLVTFQSWARQAWAEVVGHTGDDYRKHLRHGLKVDFMRDEFPQAVGSDFDPATIAMYFAKYGNKDQGTGKDYQNVPCQEWLDKPGCGPGRFWGYVGLKVTRLDLYFTRREYLTLRRSMRKLVDARARKLRVDNPAGTEFHKLKGWETVTRPSGRKVRRPKRSKAFGRTRYEHSEGFLLGGWVLFGQGAADTATALIDWVTFADTEPPRPYVGRDRDAARRAFRCRAEYLQSMGLL